MSAWGSLAEIGRVGREKVWANEVIRGLFSPNSSLSLYIENGIQKPLSASFLYVLYPYALAARMRNL